MREAHLGVGKGLELREDDRREPVLLEMQPIGIRREVGDLAQIPLDDDALAPVADLPARDLDRGLVHLLGDAVGRHQLERGRVVGPGAQVYGERRLRLEHHHAHVPLGQRERREQTDRSRARGFFCMELISVFFFRVR
jgi:hypothetical protein